MGREAARRFAAEGATVVGCDIDEEALAETPNVNVHLCSLAAKGNGITADEQLIERAHLAPTATAHCAKRQLEGWAYVRG